MLGGKSITTGISKVPSCVIQLKSSCAKILSPETWLRFSAEVLIVTLTLEGMWLAQTISPSWTTFSETGMLFFSSDAYLLNK